jgi:hypothetical protein
MAFAVNLMAVGQYLGTVLRGRLALLDKNGAENQAYPDHIL